MSLRTRLLIAIGVIAVVALAIADVITYSALQSFLYQRVDQQLASAHAPWEHTVEQGGTPPCPVGCSTARSHGPWKLASCWSTRW